MAGATGAPLNLTWPDEGTEDWDTNYVNVNWGLINTWAAATNAAIAAAVKGDTGPVGLIWAGPWNAGVSYVPTNAVYFNGSSYICLASNVNAEPDTHPTSWAILASQGIQGIQGIQGPAGTGGGTTVTFPISLAQGGTGVDASTPAQARGGIGAAASGNNSDITALSGIPGMAFSGAFGPTITLSGTLDGQPITLTLTPFGVNNPGGSASFSDLTLSLDPNGKSLLSVNPGGFITSSDPGGGTIVLGADPTKTGPCPVLTNNGLLISGAVPAAAAGQVALGGQTSSTASPGGGQVPPATVLGYLLGNIGGTPIKLAYYAA